MGDIRASSADAARPDPPSAESSEREVTVLVTGFGPFLSEHPINPSWEIARHLPSHLTLPPCSPPTPNSKPSTSSSSTKIKIITPAAPLRVSYHPTATILPELLAAHAPDVVLHIGLAAGRNFFAIERSSARLGYARNDDVDGRRWTTAESDAAWPRARGYPDRLETGLGFAGVWEGWREGCCERVEGVVGDGVAGAGGGGEEVGEGRKGGKRRKMVIRPFDSVGSYLCGFSYYTSLAWFWARECEREERGVLQEGVERPVLFLHVPACPEDEDVLQGKEITEELIKAMVACWVTQKERNEKQREAIAA